MNNVISYTPDYINEMIPDEVVEDAAIRLISQLKPQEKELWRLYYSEHKRKKDIAEIMGISYESLKE